LRDYYIFCAQQRTMRQKNREDMKIKFTWVFISSLFFLVRSHLATDATKAQRSGD